MLRAVGALNMKYLAAARRIACVVILLLGAFSAQRIPADEAGVIAATTETIYPTLPYQNFGNALAPIVIASSEFSPPPFISELTPPPGASAQPSAAEDFSKVGALQAPIVPKAPVIVALAETASANAARKPQTPLVEPPQAVSQWPAPARFFTINQVLAKHQRSAETSSAVHLASIDPKVMSDAPSPQTLSGEGDEPFGLFTFRAPDGLLWAKWRKVEADIQDEAPALSRCRVNSDHCTPAAAHFAAIIKQAERLDGRAKFELVNQRVNAAIHYMTDMAQWGVADRWSAPLDMNAKGSFDTGFGDCEDYAIAKYVALRGAGVSARDLRLLLVRDNAVHLDHAVLAVRQDGHWLVLDNRWSRLIEDRELQQFAPLFALNEEGVKLFAAPYAARGGTRTPAENLAGLDIAAGDTPTSSSYANGGIVSLPLLM